MAKVTELATKVIDLLHDSTWRIVGLEKVYQWLYEAELAIANVKPEATSRDIFFSCDHGARQDLRTADENISRLLTVKRNGSLKKPGDAIFKTSREDLAAFDPGWETANLEQSASQYVYDENEPLIIYFYPPLYAKTIVNFSASVVPDPYGLVDEETETTVRDIYSPAIVEWAAARCYQEDKELPLAAQMQTVHLSNFYNLLGIKQQNEARTSPKKPA